MTSSERRDAAQRAMRDYDISQRRACKLVGVDPKTVRRDRPPDNPKIRKEMKKIANKRRRFGNRRIGVMLERKGYVMNYKKLYRLYTEEKLGVRRRRGRKRARGSRTPIPEAQRPGNRWSLDFLSDTFGASRRFRILAVNDGLVPVTFRSLNSFMQPFVRRPRGFCHLTTSVGVVDCRTH